MVGREARYKEIAWKSRNEGRYKEIVWKGSKEGM